MAKAICSMNWLIKEVRSVVESFSSSLVHFAAPQPVGRFSTSLGGGRKLGSMKSDVCICRKEDDKLGHISDLRIGDKRPHEEVNQGGRLGRSMESSDESVVKFENYSRTIWLEE